MSSQQTMPNAQPHPVAETDVTNLTTDLAAKAPLASPALTGNPTAPTQAVDDDSTKLATTAYVQNQLSSSGDGTPAMDGTAARGTSTHGARADHVHPTDTSRQAALGYTPENTANKDVASGYAGLDANVFLKLAEQCTSVNSQGGTSYTVVDGDRAKSLVFTNGSAVAVSLPQAGASSQFKAGWFAEFLNSPASGSGAVTITVASGTINNASAITLLIGNSVLIVSDGSNYWAYGVFAVGTPSDGYIPVYVAASGNVQWLSASAASGSNAIQLRGKNIASSVGTAGNAQDGMALVWVNANSDFELASPLPKSQTVAVTTASLASGGTQTGTITMAMAAKLIAVAFSSACRVQLYASTTARDADANRGAVPPTPGQPHGVLSDSYFTNVSPYTSPFACSPSAEIACLGTTLALTQVSMSGSNATYTYTSTGAALAVGQKVFVYGMTNSGNNGTFYITGTGAGTFTVVNASGVNESGSTGAGFSQSTSIAYRITNIGTGAATITVTLYFVPQES